MHVIDYILIAILVLVIAGALYLTRKGRNCCGCSDCQRGCTWSGSCNKNR